ncbi:MAG: FtsW/RodA/SpoVE family cell cycle protein [candidate division WOR-3 bacterium]|nr:FtsW/RodA/SpoVE family cell cycle protein [candidate division WOR-3 bacterium]MDW8149884.1 FtsW/RodA/SpoVE family cell cycle protein [candidate division WOR-3 bacterium]
MLKNDIYILFVYLILLAISTIVVYTSSSYLAYVSNKPDFYYMISHFSKVLIAIGFFALGYFTNLEILKKYSFYIFFVSLLLLLLVLILPSPIAPEIRGAKRWLNLFVMSIQVSDIYRLAVILLISFISKSLIEYKNFLTIFLLVFIGIFLIAIEPNLSTAGMIVLIFLITSFYIGVNITLIGLIGLVLFLLGILAIYSFPHAMARFSSTEAYQVLQSKVGLAHGGLFGVGIGDGKAKFLYLPDAHTDFIFSIIGEEMGFIFAVFILLLIMFLVIRGLIISYKLSDKFFEASVLAFAISINIAIYTLGHISVVVGIFPPTGISMPFISFGGSSLIVNSFLLGILYQISRLTRI